MKNLSPGQYADRVRAIRGALDEECEAAAAKARQRVVERAQLRILELLERVPPGDRGVARAMVEALEGASS